MRDNIPEDHKITKQFTNTLEKLHHQAVELEVKLQREMSELNLVEKDDEIALHKLQRQFEQTIESMAMILGLRDPYMAAHEQRTAALAVAIGEEMDLSANRIKGLKIAALLHDIGEIRIPAGILSKTAELSVTEYEIVRTHPKVGYDILKGIAFPWPVAKIVLQHHERIDGSGYPEGLSNDEIMLEAKILGVAEVVEAMFSPRPFRDARGIEEALEEISKEKGVLYSPNVADSCVRLFREKGVEFPS